MAEPLNIPPLVTVVCCTYNGESFLGEQLDSILCQTYPNLEILISDDASSDGTVSILHDYRKKDPRVRILVNEMNLGYNRNFEKAIREAAGNIIAISDQDDIWECHKIETMMRGWPEKTSFIFSLSGTIRGTDSQHRIKAPSVRYREVTDLFQLVFNSPVHGHACLFKKETAMAAMPFPEDIFYDWWISMHAALEGNIGYIPQTLTWHRVHERNHSRDLMSIPDKKIREQKLREQVICFIERFTAKHPGVPEKINGIQEYAALLKRLDGNRFSWPMFRFIFKNRKRIFHYKKRGPFFIFSCLKHAFRMSKKGLL